MARWTARLVSIALPAQLAAQQYSVLDWRVVTFAACLVVLTGVVFGVLPAWLVGRMQPTPDAFRSQTGAPGLGPGRMRAALIALQAALAVALVAASVTLGRSFMKLVGTDLGFRTDHVVTLNVSFSGTSVGTAARQSEYSREAVERLRGIPGVESAGAVSFLPLINRMGMAGHPVLESGEEGPISHVDSAGPGYFGAMGTQIVAGRDFTDRDARAETPGVIVSDDLAKAFGGAAVVGRRVGMKYFLSDSATIVGVARSQRYAGPSFGGSPTVFVPLERFAPGFVTFVVRVRGATEAYLPVCRGVVAQIDRAVPVYDVKTLDARLAENMAKPRFYAVTVLFLGGFALLLAAIGVYGVATHAVAQRYHEIGVRIAVGGAPAKVRLMLLRESLWPVVAGCTAGLGAAAGLGRFLEHLIVKAEPVGVWTCAASAFLLAATAAAAVWSATRRVTKMDPLNALRAE